MHSPAAILNLHLGNFNLPLDNSAFWMLMTVGFIGLLGLLCQRLKIIPGRLQNIFEVSYEFIDQQILKPVGLTPEWLGFLFSLFLFILFNNIIGLLPGVHTPTSKITVTATLAIFVFLAVHILGLKKKGFLHYIQSLMPEGVSGPILLILFPLEIISQFLRPFSLAIRLFANLTAGHLLILSFLGFNLVFKSFFVYPIALSGAVIISLFEVFVSFIQAYIFVFLSALYIKEAVTESH